MERALGLMAGAGPLPGRAAAEAARQGWRVVAWSFEDAPALDRHCEAVVASRLDNVQAILADLVERRISAALFVGKFWKQRLFTERARGVDEAARRIGGAGLSDGALGEMVVSTLGALGIDVLDQRDFLPAWMASAGTLGARAATDAEGAEIRAGLRCARALAAHGVGQTIVRSLGVTVAVEAIEGTDETIRRGTRLAGPGAIVVKAVAPDQDYRFDMPTIGPATIAAMAEGGATALGIESGKLLLVDREELVRLADAAGIALVSIDEHG